MTLLGLSDAGLCYQLLCYVLHSCRGLYGKSYGGLLMAKKDSC